MKSNLKLINTGNSYKTDYFDVTAAISSLQSKVNSHLFNVILSFVCYCDDITDDHNRRVNKNIYRINENIYRINEDE